MAKVTIQKLQEMKQNGEKISYVTAYDFGQATLVEKAGIEMILVGDSMSMTMLGNDSTVPLTTDQMVHHIKAVVKGAPSPMIVGDLVFGSYNEGPEQAIRSANRLLKEGGCDVVKLEGCMPETVRRMVEAGIGVQGHIGLTPQTAGLLGGFKLQGKNMDAARKIVEQAKALEEAGAFSLVVECVPEELGRAITEAVKIPVIGIGAGRYCDGQVLVYHDLLGMFDRFRPKFVKKYADIGDQIVKALQDYKQEVRDVKFPSDEYVFGGLSKDDIGKIY
ncbi:3-methyl-2-oxobutanoate hydroxymethyltransferase [Fretibacterium sp. OH1220_COT-178]|uniref:3-methyl-2-oxobutanoate hydroxymethyltransferase n=1 Tax=Fretibacterium sp. OH1220_COT-178 TaxID=2491047 RepID=UPI000F5DB88C|nr:3-methyl-2-oxobutanoate hydroxymethyltransferase [Fretibacterium sp. OH1220_COT-178]RRD64152.1 3-methyl-2-oxobutanoate hydroxymethyltransferase [Fretibacterium sp. OH1220_COT-178]